MLFKKKLFKSEAQKAAEALPRTKKVQFLPADMGETKAMLDDDVNSILTLEPVNYYADKYKYLLCTLYYDDAYSRIYFCLEYCVNDKPTDKSDFYSIDFELMRSILRKFGQNIAKNA